MPKKNFDAELKGIDGTVIKRDEKPLSMSTLIIEALMYTTPNDRSTGEQKFKKYQIANKISAGGEIELTPEEMVIIKEAVGAIYSPLFVGQMYTVINQ